WKMHRFIKKLEPDVVFVNGLLFPWQLIQLKWKLGKKIRIIAIHHAEKPFQGVRKLFQKKADRCIDAYLFTSNETGMDWVKRGIIADEKKVVEVMEASTYFGVMDKVRARSRTGLAAEGAFLWVGRLNANKDPLTVLKAFGDFINYRPSARLYMIYHTDELLH